MPVPARPAPSLDLRPSPSPARPAATPLPPPGAHPRVPHPIQAGPPHRTPPPLSRHVSTLHGSAMDEKHALELDATPLSSFAPWGSMQYALPHHTHSPCGEKAHARSDGQYVSLAPGPSSTRPQPYRSTHQLSAPLARQPSPVRLSSAPPLSAFPSPYSSSGIYPYATMSRGLRFAIAARRLKPWLPLILYVLTSLGFVVAITMWKVEVFQRLDELSHWLQAEEEYGYAILFFLIFLTTIPPVPLYSTLTILSGYTFGPWTGAVISYFAALSGALTVFALSRTYFRDSINQCLSHTVTMQRVVRAIEKRPKLLFLIRLAPYPYNVMNALLAGSPTLTLRTYALCTALSLFKVIIHTSIGSSIHSFASHAGADEGDDGGILRQTSTIGGIGLCVAVAVYLSYVARRAVDEELGEEGALALTEGDEEMAEREWAV